MYMLREDGKVLANYTTFKVVANATFSKDKKIALTGTTQGFAAEEDILAFYADEKTAMDELEKIFAAIKEGKTCYTIER